MLTAERLGQGLIVTDFANDITLCQCLFINDEHANSKALGWSRVNSEEHGKFHIYLQRSSLTRISLENVLPQIPLWRLEYNRNILICDTRI